jgi:probable selenium-dependent hydroxylase accessory protein YqeC
MGGEQKEVDSLINAFAIDAREHIALVGAGGKTALLFALADELRRAGKRVVTSTTTKVWQHQAWHAPCIVLTEGESSWKEKLEAGLAKDGHTFLARMTLDSGKMDGIDPLILNGLFSERSVEYLLVEADGAAGLPVKAPAAHEPVIPASTTMVVAIMGLDALGRRPVPGEVFRPDAVKEVTGLKAGETLNSSSLAGIFLHPEGVFKGTPDTAKRIAFLNKLDLLENEGEALDLAARILKGTEKKISRVVVGSIRERRYTILERESIE